MGERRSRTDGLLVEAGRGDLRALGALYDATSPAVYGFLLRELGSAARAEVAALQVYVDVWRAAPRYDPRRCSALSLLLAAARQLAGSGR